MKRARSALGVIGVFVLVLGGCSKPPLDREVNARSPASYLFWTGDVAKTLTKGEQRQLDVALQELKFEIMERGIAVDPADPTGPLRRKIHGKTVRAVLADGFSYRATRLTREHDALAAAISDNQRLVPADVESRQHLEKTLAGQRSRLEKLEADLSEARGIVSLMKP